MANYKRLFLDGHSYYFTIVTHRRNHILVENIELLRESFRESKEYFSYKIDAIVILPDHFHMIITPNSSRVRFPTHQMFKKIGRASQSS